MTVEDQLFRSARTIAAGAVPPRVPDPADLARGAIDRRRRRRVAAVAVATAATLAALAVLGPSLAGRGGTGERTGPAGDGGTGDAPVFVDADGDLHVGDTVVPTEGGAFPRFAATSTGVAWMPVPPSTVTARPPGGQPLRHQPVEGEAVELADDALFVTSDPLGDNVTWVTADRTMVTYDVVERRVLDRRDVRGIDVPEVPLGTALPVLYVGETEVAYELRGQVRVVDLATGEEAVLPDVSADALLDYAPGLQVVAVGRTRDSTGAATLTGIELRGASGTVSARPARLFREGRLSPDGRWFVTSTGYEDGLVAIVLRTSTGRSVPLGLPERWRGMYDGPWGWTGRDVLTVGINREGRPRRDLVEEVWACRLGETVCEPVPGAAPVYPS